MKYKIFTTVGTSITKTLKFSGFDDKSFHENWENNRKATFCTNKSTWKGNIKKHLNNTQLSAEISSLHKIHESLKEGDKYEVYLLCTDTLASAVCAWAIQQWFEGNKDKYTKFSTVRFDSTKDHIVENLRITNQTDYDSGFMALIDILKNKTEISKEEKEKGEGDILNITGGYKAIIPILTLYGQLREMRLQYIYNETELKDAVLVTVGNLPIGFDAEKIERIYPLLDEEVLKNIDTNALDEAYKLKLVDDTKRKRTALGELFFTYANDYIPEGKTALGILVEYKLVEFFNLYSEERKTYIATRSVVIDDNSIGEKGNEIDILLEQRNNSLIYDAILNKEPNIAIKEMELTDYIACEVKPLSKFSNGDKFKKDVRKQFTETCSHISKCQHKPTEFRYIVYTLLKDIPDSIMTNVKNRMVRVRDEIVEGSFPISFWLITLNIPETKDAYKDFLQNPIEDITKVDLN
ncbi:MAG: hypothetical protein JNM36_05335 [Chitinophagales bacterium]|nr:hypothetical protein [Chitinophagales bacterium]